MNRFRFRQIVLLLAGFLPYSSSCDVNRASRSDLSLSSSPRVVTLHEGNAQINIQIAARSLRVSDQQITTWVHNAARAVSRYFGRFPQDGVVIAVASSGDGKVQGGITNYEGIQVTLGSSITNLDFSDDWVMTHEMFHLSFPTMDEQYVWLSEGRATYLEPIARARQGTISASRFWSDFVEEMPQGQPEPGDRGLDLTHTWGRTYWGGAMFCLIADVRIRQQTANTKSLDDAMRAVLNQGGNHLVEWSLSRFIEVGDRATGTQVLQNLHQEMGAHPVTVDLQDLWNRLGVIYDGGHVSFSDSAPLAAVRRAITR
jgi:hypothetical protein